MAIFRRIIGSLVGVVAGFFGGIGVERMIGQEVPTWVIFLLAAVFGFLAFFWERVFEFVRHKVCPPKPLSKLQKDVIAYLGGMSNGSCSFRYTMEYLEFDYNERQQVGKFNLLLVELKKQNIVQYENENLRLTSNGWDQYFALSKTVADQR